jgi:hypothetical protein
MSDMALMEVQRALYTKLSGDGVLMGMVTGVYDVVPQKTALPYVVIGDGRANVEPADELTLTELQMQIEVWGDATGRKKVLTILNRIFSLMHMGTLTLAGYQHVLLRCEQADTEIVEQGQNARGVLIVRAVVVEV